MIGLDANILVRYLAQDDPAQSKLANQLIEYAVETGALLWICQITLCETVWVLKKCYKMSKQEIIHILQELLQIPQIKVEHDDATWIALNDFETNKDVSFADCLIGRQNIQNGCVITYTFDKAAATQCPAIYKALTPKLHVQQ
jgi:predicted nucleic-acid-binding protein